MATTAEPQWEYKVTTIGNWLGVKDEVLEAALNELGQAGWEVLTVTPVHSSGQVMVVARRTLTPRRRRARAGEGWAEG